jgi:uncharacterized protein YndB with AHSA1/START domain
VILPRPLEIDTPSEREVVIRRGFDAPPELVFDAHTLPGLLRRWYGPPGWEMTVCDIDLRPGGSFRYVTRQPGGREIAQFGIFRVVSRPSRLVHSERWEDWDPGEVMVTAAFAPEGAGTLLMLTTLFPTRDVRDQLIALGMTEQTEPAYRKLDGLLSDYQTR